MPAYPTYTTRGRLPIRDGERDWAVDLHGAIRGRACSSVVIDLHRLDDSEPRLIGEVVVDHAERGIELPPSNDAARRALHSPRTMTGLLYGTAWKEDETERLVGLALAAGFRAIDTANQRKHYHEAGVGAALAKAYAAGIVRREELFLQTKFTHVGGQDARLPYDAGAPIATQVKQSFASSLAHLGTTRLDAYVLHGPSTRRGLAPADLEAWRAMEAIHAEGGTTKLGVSNVTREQLERLLREATVAPSYVQNRCHARTGWDREVRAVCREHGIVYQGFSLLTANRAELAKPIFRDLDARLGLTPAQLVFRFALDVGMFPITGTTSPDHMKEDLAASFASPLDEATLHAIATVAT